MKKLLIAAAALFILVQSQAQDKYFTKSGKIHFYSEAPLEDIEATNKSASAILDAKTGMLQFSVLIKGFEFDKAEMQEHFNEHYLESDKFPKAEFKGQVVNNASVSYGRNGTYPVQVKGMMTLHGVTKEVLASGQIRVEEGVVRASSTFHITVADYGIVIPRLVRDKIAKTVRVMVDAKLDPLKG